MNNNNNIEVKASLDKEYLTGPLYGQKVKYYTQQTTTTAYTCATPKRLIDISTKHYNSNRQCTQINKFKVNPLYHI